MVLELLENVVASAKAGGVVGEPSNRYQAVVSGLAYFASFGLCCNVTVLCVEADGGECAKRVILRTNVLAVLTSLAALLYLAINFTEQYHINQAVFAGLMLAQVFYWVALKGPANVNWFVVLQIVIFVVVLIVASLVNPEDVTLEAMVDHAVIYVKALTLEPLMKFGFEEGKMLLMEKKRESWRHSNNASNVRSSGVTEIALTVLPKEKGESTAPSS